MSVLQPAPIPHTTDPTLAATDSVAPAVPVIASLQIAQYKSTISGSKCAPISNLTVDLQQVTDNASPAAKLGYQFELVAGRLPKGLVLPTTPVRPGGSDMVDPPHFIFTFGDSDQDIDFSLAVKAVDEAGNVSAASTAMQVVDAGGCSVAGPPSAGGLLLALVGLALLRRASSRVVAHRRAS